MIKHTDPSETFHLLIEKYQKIPLVVVHGVGVTHEFWKPLIDYLINHTTLSYDILGHGKTPLKKTNISFDDFSEQLIKLINELNFQKIHLVGFSIGSLVARNFATKHNDRLQSLILLGSIYKRSEEQQKIVNDRFNLAKKDHTLSKQALKRWFTDNYLEKNPNIYEKISSILEGNNMENFFKVYELFILHKNDENFKNIKVNTLIMTGENDIGSTVEMSKNLSNVIENSQLKVIKNGKHLCGIECADEVNMTIKNFIKDND